MMLITRLLPAALALGFLATPAVAFAHAYPKTTTPAKDSTVQGAPSTVSIEFDDELEPAFSTIVVHDEKGDVVSTGKAAVAPTDPKSLSVAVKPLAPGRYMVMWTATDTDTHKTKGSYSFTVAK